MPGGHASHKGSASKPNVNASGVIGEAADTSGSPEDVLPEEMTNNAEHRAQEFVDFPPALERPQAEQNPGNQAK